MWEPTIFILKINYISLFCCISLNTKKMLANAFTMKQYHNHQKIRKDKAKTNKIKYSFIK